MIRVQAPVCSPKFYGPLTIWPWLRISPQGSLNVSCYLIISAWQWSMSFTHKPCIPMKIKPNKSPLRNRFLVLLLWEIGHLSSPSRSCLGRLILICGSQGGGVRGHPAGALRVEPPHRRWHTRRTVLFLDLSTSYLCMFRLWTFINYLCALLVYVIVQ